MNGIALRQHLIISSLLIVAVIAAALSGFVPDVLEVPGRGKTEPKTPEPLTVYVALSPDCPISNAMLPHLNELHQRFAATVDFVGLVPEQCAPLHGIHEYVTTYDLRFPVQVDTANTQCGQLRLSRTPEAAVCDGEGTVLYRGRIDDRFVRIASAARPVSDQTLLRAIEATLKGRTPEHSHIHAVGCLIPRQHGRLSNQATGPTFAGSVGQLLYDNCTKCHRPGEPAPFVIQSYDDVRRHGEQILEVVERRLMPPWKPARDFGQFRNEHRLSPEQIQLLSTWIRSGMPRGPEGELPEVPVYPDGWQLGEPDLVLQMPEAFSVPADGPDIYQHFVIPSMLTENRLVRAVEFRPGAAEAVHHAFMYLDTTGTGRRLDAASPGLGYERLGSPGFAVSGTLGGWGPGGTVVPLPEGMGRPMHAGSDLILQIHYHPSGRKVRDLSSVGIYFADDDATQLVTEILIANTELQIPAGEESHHHSAEWSLPVDVMMLDATPHMHTLGRQIQAEAIRPDGRREPLIRINDWDFYWQDSYAWQEPIVLPRGTKIRLDCWFDNSSNNALNPNSPPQTVGWGDYSTDEMGVCYFRVTTRSMADYQTLNRAVTEYFQGIDPD